jgi:hypothetical protein
VIKGLKRDFDLEDIMITEAGATAKVNVVCGNGQVEAGEKAVEHIKAMLLDIPVGTVFAQCKVRMQLL